MESKRYEPFRPAKKNEFAESYDRKVWGENMEGYTRLRPVLLYLYAEPVTWANGRAVKPERIEAHRADIKLFSESVAGDEAAFAPMAWVEMLALWGGKKEVADHAARVAPRFGPL